MSTDITRPEQLTRPGLITFLSSVAVSVVLLGFGLAAAQRHAGAVADSRLAEQVAGQRGAALERGTLFVPRLDAELLPMTPASTAWDTVPEIDIPLQKQTIAMPMLEKATVETVRLQAVTDGERIVWRVSWRDPSVDANVDVARFSDAVAMQFPIARDADFSMGARGRRVHILHWKALWQKDVDEHFQDVQDLHPNYWTDLYWFAQGERPYPIPGSFKDPRSHQWFAAYSAGNPMSDIHRVLAVEELTAEGYGTLSPQEESMTVGGGAWQDGEWAVVFARPLQTDDPMDYQIATGGRGNLGIAVWDGSAGNVGGRKHWTNWVEFEVSL